MTTRARKIEQMLAEWFRREGWELTETTGFASLYQGDGMGGAHETEINLERLAAHIDREMEGWLK